MMRILITGSNGFVAQKFCAYYESIQAEGQLLGISKSANRNRHLSADSFLQIDLADFGKLTPIIDTFRPTHILHTAALSSVDACAQNPDLAKTINIDLSVFLGQYAVDKNIHLTFLSTDFVFDGKNGPYKESDPTCPINAYGQTKVEAEHQLLALKGNIAILRTILVYGYVPDPTRSNLVLWAKTALEQGKSIQVVEDQWRMPTWVDDLVHACYLSMDKKAQGLFHISGNELFSIKEIVYQLADHWHLNKSLVQPISAKVIGQDTNRPRSTGFDLTKSKEVLGFIPTSFSLTLQKIEQQLNKR